MWRPASHRRWWVGGYAWPSLAALALAEVASVGCTTNHESLPDQGKGSWSQHRLASQKVASASIRRRVAELRHCSGFDLADPLAGQVEVLTDLLQRARLPAVKTETQPEDGCLAIVEGREKLVDLVDKQRPGSVVEWRQGVGVGHHVPQIGVPVLA